jgi:hypothetical protein
MIPQFAHTLICTGYPPKTAGEQIVNNPDSPVKSGAAAIPNGKLFTAKMRHFQPGEQVL